MSRTSDPTLTERIISEAHRLWHKGGEEAVTLRAVAQAAKTSTPSVYSRFASKEDLIAELAVRVNRQLAQKIIDSGSLPAACRTYLEVAHKLHREYRLVFGPSWGKVFRKGTPRPGLEWTVRQFVKKHGGDPEQYRSSVYAIWYLLHGTASILQYLP